MEYISISKIKVKDNVRTDYGDLTELAESIKRNGVRDPLLLSKKNELIDGHRRLKCAIAKGLTKVPYFYSDDKLEKSELQMIAGIFGKNLNPIEEAQAFKNYMDKHKCDAAYLSLKLGKKEDYIRRRVNLVDATKEVKDALIKKKIQLGHAAVLARMESKAQKQILKRIIEEDYSVADMDYAMHHDSTYELEDAPFNKKDCKECKHNGSEQTLLIDNDNMKGRCLNPSCYLKKVNAWLQSERDKLKKRGITVLMIDKAKQIQGAREIKSWEDNYQHAAENLEKKPDIFAVVFDNEDEIPEKQLWILKQPKEKKPTKAAEKNLNLSRKEKQKHRVASYKRNLCLSKVEERAEEGSHEMKVLAAWSLMQPQKAGWSMDPEVEQLLKDAKLKRTHSWGGGWKGIMPMLDKMQDAVLDSWIKKLAAIKFEQMSKEELDYASAMVGFDLKKHWEIGKDFLELYSKDQIIDLDKELKLNTEGLTGKKSDAIEAFMKNNLKGKVPKIMQEV